MLRTTTGKVVSWDSHPSEDRSEPPLQRRNGSIIVPIFSIIASSRTTRLFSPSVDRSLLYGRSWRQKASRFEKRGKIRSTDYSVVKEPRRRLLFAPSLYNGHLFADGGVCSKKFFKFFPHGCNSLNNRLVVNPFLPCILTNTYSTEHDNIEYFKLNGTK